MTRVFHSLPVWTWASRLTHLSLSFLVSEMRRVLSLWGC